MILFNRYKLDELQVTEQVYSTIILSCGKLSPVNYSVNAQRKFWKILYPYKFKVYAEF